MFKVLGPLPPTEENWMKFLAAGFRLVQPWLLYVYLVVVEGEPAGQSLCVCLSLPLSALPFK